ncbi:MAG TPA: hypothetical protein VGY56_14315 [Verrucomicrobiae bacterium]|nr:hypothetical protein [Verrucomicrobiae bacterium]
MKKNPINIPAFGIALAALYFWTPATNTLAQTECIDTNGIKYLQPPNLAGYDDSDSLGYVLADDFVCTNAGPIIGIHIWGSWLSNVHGVITNFVLGIYSDVPAVTNAGGAVTPSHPGGLLWTESFGPGQFSENPYSASQEQFISPASVNVIGSDSEAWLYCFFPTNPFTQTGSSSAPTIYWLGAYAEGQNFGPQYNEAPQYGWKTTAIVQNDISVFSPWPGTMPPAGAPWTPNTTPPNGSAGPQPIDLAFELTTVTNSVTSCCPDTDELKYEQLPDLSLGIDVDATSTRGGVLADDFPCIQTGPITDIHIWGSWLNDIVDPNATFILSIWSDVPSLPTTGQPSHPGQLLWTQTFGPGQYVLCPFTKVPEPFDDPNYNPPIPPSLNPFGGSTNLDYLCFYAFPTNEFIQRGTAAAPTNYWLSVSYQFDPNQPAPLYFGWKTSATHYGDAAVASLNVPYPPPTAWESLVKVYGINVDFSFKMDTATNVPQVCMESDGPKYVQWPNTGSGFDVWDTPYVLADDFVCTNPSAIADIHLWGSWINDVPLTNTINFWLGIYNDVPANAANPYSHPGTNLLWQQWFAPGQYVESIWAENASEQFLNPGTSNVLGGDSEVWYYCFYPTNPFVQLGTMQTNQIYWLAAYAQLPVGINDLHGWKTATNVLNDTSVWAPWPGVPPTNNPGWTPTYYQPPTGGPGKPLDLAFLLTTPTNCSLPITITYYETNTLVVVKWGTGILQAATNSVLGPYVDVPGAVSPYTNIILPNPPRPPYKFYRLRCN